ncbi:MAG TPA: hypothetical protein EYG73_09830 [Arcobacter sp.]|nr:hypothetical protein [Arcobacter sp.]
MFSFIKRIQELLSKLKKNKGLFFTTLTILSVSGIAVFMYIILTMTGTIKEKVYLSISDDYIKTLQNILDQRKEKYLEISKAISINKNIIKAVESNDKKSITIQSKELNKAYKKNGINSLKISFFPVRETKAIIRQTISSTLRSKSQVFGIEVQQSGVYITLIKPIMKNGKFIGLMEIKESIHSLRKNFEAQDNNYVFLLDKKQLVKLSLKTKSGRYKAVINDYLVYQSAYSSRFYSKITDTGEDQFLQALKTSHDSDDVFFRTYKKTTDINGVEIGLYVMGEQIEKNNGFVNIADNMIKSVTYVSLGLVISILLFMF